MARTAKTRKQSARLQSHRPVVGFEAEFTLFVGGRKRRPETVFTSPQQIVRRKMIPRAGRSFHLPSGGAIYFDTGVIEVATPIIEIEPGCCVRAGRSLWEQIVYLRAELDAWEKNAGTVTRLEGFSTHFNVSTPPECGLTEAGLRQFARLLTCILHVPVMLLAANRLSTGVGVRPRGNRVEVTVDFTPDPDLMISAASLATGIILGVLRWPHHGLSELARRRIPVIAGFKPRRHTSRKGFLARFDCFPRSPFTADPNARDWLTTDGRTMSLREMATEIAAPFRHEIRDVTCADRLEHIFAVFDGRARSLLDFPERPPRYEDVGRIVDWNRHSIRKLPRSEYERVIHRIVEHRPLRLDGALWLPERMEGWYEIVFRNTRNGRRRTFNLDDLVEACRSGHEAPKSHQP
jgi:hypothetical protein